MESRNWRSASSFNRRRQWSSHPATADRAPPPQGGGAHLAEPKAALALQCPGGRHGYAQIDRTRRWHQFVSRPPLEKLHRMTPLHTQTGAVAGFVHGDWILDRHGRALAMVANGVVWNSQARCVGWWAGDHLRGMDGGVIAFVRGVRNLGLQMPIAAAAERTPSPLQPVGRWTFGVAPAPPAARITWSNTSFGAW